MTDAVLFISFGGPEKKEDVRPFLEIVTRGRKIPAERIDAVAHHYEQIGGASPINAITRSQSDKLRALLAKNAMPLPVYVGNRNWHPFIEDTLRKMVADGVKSAVGFVTAAHRTEASWERYVNAVEAARQKVGPSAPVITYTGPWYDNPLFIDAIAARIHAIIDPMPQEKRDRLSWIFTAHSIPTAMAKNSRYVEELTQTAERVCAKFGVKKWKQAYTSRSGAPSDPWLEPDICDEIETQAKAGVRHILAIPIGFVADHVEVLFDLDVEAKEAAQKATVAFHRAQTVGDHPIFIQMIAELVSSTIGELQKVHIKK